MQKIFDWHKWNAVSHEKPEDIIRAFNALGVIGKRIASIRIIGAAVNNAEWLARKNQHEAGVPYSVIDNGGFAYAQQTMIPCELELTEPIVFTLTDGSTFELQPRHHDSLMMSVNQIAAEVIHGTNNGNVNVNGIFRNLIGATLRSLNVQTFTREDIRSPNLSKGITQFRRYQFWTDFSDAGGFTVTQRGGAWYSVEVRDQKHFTHEGNELVKVPLVYFTNAFNPHDRQIPILEGHDYSSYFWINPVKIVGTDSTYDHDSIEEYIVEEISIEEDDVLYYLDYFLKKHFDPKLQVPGLERQGEREFEWNLEHNLYTYDTIKTIIAEIRSVAEIFKNDFDNAALSEIKSRFSVTYLTDLKYHDSDNQNNGENREKIIRENIELVLDFYERFCRRLELMMEYSPQYNLISFMGP